MLGLVEQVADLAQERLVGLRVGLARVLAVPVVERGLDPVALDQIETSSSFEGRVGAVRGFTRDNPARAALAVRDMIAADAKS